MTIDHCDARFRTLFEPVAIGPVTAPNRFYQVPHASGATNANPRVRAGLRAVKAEGGWGVICTVACSIHPSCDDAPLPFATMWDEDDIRAHTLMTEAVHEHGALAGVELFHGGGGVLNRQTRLPALTPSGKGWSSNHSVFMSPGRPRAMDAADLKDLVHWQAEAAKRAKLAGFDIIYVYAGMGYLPHEFMLPDYNERTDGYGGSMENRVRIIREMLEATRDALGDGVAVALRISLEELLTRPGTVMETEAHEAVSLLSPYTDLFDVKMDSSPTDCGPSRFVPEASHEGMAGFVKTCTDKPVVGVGRFTSPDTMVSQVRRGVLDFIGAARPSIADPFLPNKIREGREDEIRECIGCNMCIASWHEGVLVRCTQNPSFGEEWRRGWHPEKAKPAGSTDRVLIVGGGPAGLECALTLGRRGYDVAVAEAGAEMGGRVLFESALPGLSAWRRVIDYRLGRLKVMPNVELYPGSALDADQILEFGFERVVLATGATWTPALFTKMEIAGEELDHPNVYTPSDLAAGAKPEGPVVVLDYDFHVMGGVLAEKIAASGQAVTYVSPAGGASAWTINANEQIFVHRRLHEMGVPIRTLERVSAFDGATATVADMLTDREVQLPCKSLVIVGLRRQNSDLYDALADRQADWADAGIRTVERTGDALSPGAIAHAVFYGRATAEAMDGPKFLTFKRDGAFHTPPERNGNAMIAAMVD